MKSEPLLDIGYPWWTKGFLYELGIIKLAYCHFLILVCMFPRQSLSIPIITFQIVDGGPFGKSLGVWCGQGTVEPIITSSNTLYINFTSDSSTSRTGFFATYKGNGCWWFLMCIFGGIPKCVSTSTIHSINYQQSANQNIIVLYIIDLSNCITNRGSLGMMLFSNSV